MSALAGTLLRHPSRAFFTCLLVMLFFATGGGAYLLLIVGYLEKQGLNVTRIGSVMSLLSVVEGLTCLLVGQIYRGRRTVPVLALALILNAASALILATRPLGALVWISAALTGAGFAIFTVVMYVAALRVRPASLPLGLAVGLYTGCIAAGNGLGALLGGWVTDRSGFVASFTMAAGCYAIGMLGLLMLIGAFRSQPAAAPEMPISSGPLPADPRPIWVIAILTAFCLSSLVMVFDILFPVYSLRAGMSFVFIGTISGLKMILAAVMRPLAGVLMTRISPVVMNYTSLIGLGIGTMAIPFAGAGPGMLAVIALMGITFGSGRAVSAMLVVQNEHRPAAISQRVSYYNTGLNLGQMISPWFIGVLADRLSLDTAFVLIPACFFGLTGLVYLCLPRLSIPLRNLTVK